MKKSGTRCRDALGAAGDSAEFAIFRRLQLRPRVGNQAVVSLRRASLAGTRAHCKTPCARQDRARAGRRQRTMHSLELPAAVTDFVESAAGLLQAEVATGAEVEFELEGQATGRRAGAGRSGGAVLYAYRALTDRFIGERWVALARLPSYQELARLLVDFGGLERYLASVGADPSRGDLRARVSAAISALLCEGF